MDETSKTDNEQGVEVNIQIAPKFYAIAAVVVFASVCGAILLMQRVS